MFLEFTVVAEIVSLLQNETVIVDVSFYCAQKLY